MIYLKKEKIPFFNLTSACILETINEIPEFRRRIVDGKVVEYEKINAVSPIMQNDHTIREIEIKPASEFGDIFEWSEYVENELTKIQPFQMNMHYQILDVLDVGSLGDVRNQPKKLIEAYEIGKKF